MGVYPLHPSRRGMQTAYGNLDFEEFTDKVKELLSRAWGENTVTFMHDEPTGNVPEGVTLPVITYDTYERVRSESHKSLEPIRFDRIPNPEREGEIIDLYRMWFDIETEFKIYHTTNRDARILMTEFEDFLWRYKSYFKEIGISDIIFLAELKPDVVEKFGQRLPERKLRYLIRVERITHKIVRTMDQIEEVVSMADSYFSQNGQTQDFSQRQPFIEDSIISHYTKQFR